MTEKEFMSELHKIILDALRKQGFSVMLLLAATLYFHNKLAETEDEQSAEISELKDGLKNCERERENLSVTVATLEVQLNEFLNRATMRKKQ